MSIDQKQELPLYSFPYRGKPRFLTEGLLRDDETTTTTNIHIMWQNSDFVRFHHNPFPDRSEFIKSPSTTSSSISPLSSPSSIESTIPFRMPSTELEVRKQKVIKQIQFLICYVIYELLFSKKSMTKKDKAKTMSENYHGVHNKPHVLHHAWYFTQGKGKFASVVERSLTDGRLHLSKEASHEEDYDFIVNEIPLEGDNSKVITLANLKRKSINSDAPFSSRSVTSYAETALRNCKIAVSIGNQFFQADGNLPSGWSRRDYFTKVLDLMYVRLCSEPKSKAATTEHEREEAMQEKRPPHWF